ncbi:hypothetical protein [Thiohalophilus sp.]|uniref:hypothetical protein n=1 Tax=Thiohalophilus sp. TaxID=3028392 RepID=UPI003975CBF4
MTSSHKSLQGQVLRFEFQEAKDKNWPPKGLRLQIRQGQSPFSFQGVGKMVFSLVEKVNKTGEAGDE